MHRKEKIEKIVELFARFRTEVESLNSLNLYDINIHAENVIIPILNLVYGVNLVNINNQVKNSAAIDLVDTENRIAIQVTSTATGEKIKHTINEFVKNKRPEDYDRLLVYIITEKQKRYSDSIFSVANDNKLEFSEKDILDYSDILKEINSFINLAKIDSLLQLLKDEFCEEEISKRRYLLEHKESIKTEILFPNILEIHIPSKVYVGIIGIDRDDIITQSWSTPNKLKKSAPMGKVLRKAFDLMKIAYCRDWFTFEDKILSFRPLDNRNEPLNRFVEIGTVEEYSINEFVNISYKYEEALLHLINRSIEELVSYKNIQWLSKEKYFRFKPIGIPRERKITWKNKKVATRSVVAEVWNDEKKQILYFRQLTFKIQSFRSNEKWFISITPGWSFTYDGYHSCKQESQLIAQKKNLESNSSVYQHFMFLSYCLTNKLEENESEYKYISFSSPFGLTLNYTSLHGN
ncbi:MAG: SMEK domain-containing protein [Firmicutes bacterium]|nr:SMEK domain-containing protein [Candidatus Alectryobacillus merdavium]